MSDHQSTASNSAQGLQGRDDATLAKLTIYIRYVYEDFGIAGALNNAVQKRIRQRRRCGWIPDR